MTGRPPEPKPRGLQVNDYVCRCQIIHRLPRRSDVWDSEFLEAVETMRQHFRANRKCRRHVRRNSPKLWDYINDLGKYHKDLP